jgi:hypothetical protein
MISQSCGFRSSLEIKWMPFAPGSLRAVSALRNLIVTGLSHGRRCSSLASVLLKPRVVQKILVVDDEPDAVELVKFNLKAAGFEFTWPMAKRP